MKSPLRTAGRFSTCLFGAILLLPLVGRELRAAPGSGFPTAGIAAASIPQPVTTHPRLWITQADLPKLRSWAVPTNPVYQQGLLPVLAQAIIDYNTCFPDGVHPASPYPDPGDAQGYIAITPNGGLSEQDAEIFALHSLIDPVPANRIKYAQYARNLIMVAMNEAAKGVLANAPFRDPLFPTYNRANLTSQAWPLAVDWIYNAVDATNQPILTAQDKATIRNVFLIWANECLNAYTNGGDHPSPVTVVNSPELLPGGNAYREAANNYYIGHGRLLTLMALAIDPTDDPAIDPNTPASTLGNTLRSYIANATGAWLYQEYAMFGDPAQVRSDYGLPSSASVGLASGGMPPEGMLYGHSIGFVLGELLALKTAGFADPAISGPQVSLANNAPVWDRFVKAFTSSLVPVAQIPVAPGSFTDPIHQIDVNEAYLGPVYEMGSYGDILRMYITPDFVQPFALLGLLDQQNGDTSRLNAERWFTVNALQGGAAGLIGRVSNPWSWGSEDALLTFLLLDPTAAPGYAYSDPRAGYATAFYDAQQGRLVEHYPDWSATGAMFDFRCSWNSINHQQDDANQFEFFRKGEWLTKGLANYDNNSIGQSSAYHNTLTLQNWCPGGTPASLQFWDAPLWPIGSQWPLGVNAGDPTVYTSVAAAYSYAYGDTTNLYNLPSPYVPADNATDITHASRSLLWLKPDYTIVYDRATSLHAGLFKRFNLTVIGSPVINGNLITTTTPGGQHLYINSLLPATGTKAITTNTVASAGMTSVADLEPATDRIVVEDTSHPTDVRFLHVLQGADAGTAAAPVTLVQSTSGTAFDGAVVANTVVMFRRDMTTPFVSVTFNLPAANTPFYMAGLTPNAGYTVSQAGTAVTVTPGGASAADQAGLLSSQAAAGSAAPSITSQPASQTAASGGNVTFGVQAAGTAPLTYQWQRLPNGGSWTNLGNAGAYGGATTATLTVTGVAVGMNGDQFRCVVSGVSPAATSNAASLAVLPPLPAAPVITIQPTPQAVTAGKDATYSVTAAGQGTLSYQWEQSSDGGSTWTQLLYSGAYWAAGSTPDLTLNAVTAGMNGYQFRCVVSNGTNPDATSNTVSLVVLPAAAVAPTITGQPAGQTTSVGGNVSFTVTAAGTAPLAYQWQRSAAGGGGWTNLTDTGAYSGSATATLSVTGATASMNGDQFQCVVSNGVSPNATSSAAALTVTSGSAAIAPAITTQPQNQAIAAGNPITFTAAASGTPAPTYQWKKDGVNISGATGSSYSIVSVGATDAGSYVVIATNSAGSATSNSAALTVTVTASVQVTSETVTNGHSATFSASSTPGVIQWQVSTDSGTTWTNLANDTTYGGTTTAALTVNNVSTGLSGAKYRFVATNSNVVGTSNAATLTVVQAFFPFPVCIAADGAGNLYVGDAQANTIQQINSSEQVSLIAGSAGTAGSADGSGSAARFNQPGGLAVLASGTVVVADTANATIRSIGATGAVTTLTGAPGNRGSTDGTGTAATFSSPTGVTTDSAGNLFVADAMNDTIRKIAGGGAVSTLAGSAGITGGTDATGSAARFNFPTGVTVDGSGNVYVADTTNNLVRKITPTGVVSTLAGLIGVAGSSDGTGNQALFNHPGGLTIDASGNLYLADTGNSTIRRIAPAGLVTTIAGLPGVAGLEDGAGNALFNQPRDLAVDSAGNLFVADTGNAAIRKITPAGVVTTLVLSAAPASGSGSGSSGGGGGGGGSSGSGGGGSASGGSTPPATAGDSGGGGAIESWFAGLLALVALVRRRHGKI